MAYPESTMVFPPSLTGETNGDLDTALMETIGPDGAMLYWTAAQAFKAMQYQALRDGISIQTSDIFNAYRPYKVQERIFLERYKTIWLPFVDKKQWNGKTWYKWYGATAAAPGTSNHGWGLAVDVKDATGNRLAWLIRNAPSFGFYWEIQSEAWHLRYCLGDSLPPFMGPVQPLPPPPPPPPSEDFPIEEMTSVSTTIHKAAQRFGTSDADPIFDFPTLNEHGKVLGGMVCHSYFVIWQRVAGEERIITVFAGGEPRAIPLPADGSAWVFPVWKEGFASVGGHSPAFTTRNADGVNCEARELWLPNR